MHTIKASYELKHADNEHACDATKTVWYSQADERHPLMPTMWPAMGATNRGL